MKVRALFWLLGLAVLAAALRHDFAAWFVRAGEAEAGAGRLAAAAASLQAAEALGGEPARLAHSLGAGHYRHGDYARARSYFEQASSDSGLAAGSRFNRGNAGVRLAEAWAAKDKDAAIRYLGEAISDYDAVLRLEPGAADARANRALAQGRLAVLRQAERQHGKDKEAAAARQRSARQGGKPAGEASAGQTAGAVAPPSPVVTPGATRRDLSQADVERLLNEARGRARPFASPQAGGSNGAPPTAARDW